MGRLLKQTSIVNLARGVNNNEYLPVGRSGIFTVSSIFFTRQPQIVHLFTIQPQIVQRFHQKPPITKLFNLQPWIVLTFHHSALYRSTFSPATSGHSNVSPESHESLKYFSQQPLIILIFTQRFHPAALNHSTSSPGRLESFY